MSEKFEPESEETAEPISAEDAVPEEDKTAFSEMLRQIELGKDNISEGPQLFEELEKKIEALLNEKEREIIKKRFLEGKSYAETAKESGMTPSQVGKIQARALEKLRIGSKIYREGLEVETGLTYRNRLMDIFSEYKNSPKIIKNKKIQSTFWQIQSLIGGTSEDHFSKLDAITFNYFCDDIKRVLDKKEYSDQDTMELESFRDRLKDEITQ